MAEQARAVIRISDFPGFVTNIDPLDAPPGAGFVQVNLASLTPGELTTRGGYREVSFEAG